MSKKTAPAPSKSCENEPESSSGAARFSWMRLFFRFAYYASLTGGAAFAVFTLYCLFTLPDIDNAPAKTRPPKIELLDANGEPISVYGGNYGEPVVLKHLPSYVYNAVVATEDRRFYEHGGVDYKSVLRAALVNLIKRRKAQGASTLTQQVAKNLFLTSDKTIARKMREMLLAFELERRLSKDKILTIYLNRVYFGAGCYGIESAAKRYFDKSAADLTLYESAVLAGLLKAPSVYNPLNNPEAADKRARVVLSLMRKAGYISDKQKDAAVSQASAPKKKNRGASQYFIDWALRELDDYLGALDEDAVVFTTMESSLQKNLGRIIADTFAKPETKKMNATQAAAVILRKDGAVAAMTGGVDYEKSRFNRAVQAKRQIGSVIKPFVYLAAFENGYSPNDVFEDREISYKGWKPKNASGKYYGRITLADALIKSVNTIAVRLAVETGVRKVKKTAMKFGIVSSDCEESGAIALGVCQTRVIDAAAAYAALANGGYGVTPYAISEVQNADGEILYERTGSGRARLTNPKYIAELDNILLDVIMKGTGKRAFPGILAKGKTGTTQNYRDAWFVGYTQDYTAAVWVGNDDETPMNKVGGNSLPSDIWGKIIRATVEN